MSKRPWANEPKRWLVTEYEPHYDDPTLQSRTWAATLLSGGPFPGMIQCVRDTRSEVEDWCRTQGGEPVEPAWKGGAA